MTAFCTKCGSALSATTRYCTNCAMENLIDTNQDMTPAVVAGVEKTMQTPHHQYVTQSGGPFGSKGRRSESIHTGDASYLMVAQPARLEGHVGAGESAQYQE
jgi:hypothetical protein